MDMGSLQHSSCTLELLLLPVFIPTAVHSCECFVNFILFRKKIDRDQYFGQSYKVITFFYVVILTTELIGAVNIFILCHSKE